ncbi:hypothetical protein CEE45_17305 [Candidatus Heimdallarchaeota archaeon B3_Heim]|nr:MAG: hypothetical protein CEE45_17305 [Candidatus Heimdallarchaeota archaeon B3_Heim]
MLTKSISTLLLDDNITSYIISVYSESEGERKKQRDELHFWMKLFLESKDEFIPKFLDKYATQFTPSG